MATAEIKYLHFVTQQRPLDREDREEESWEDNWLLIIFRFYKLKISRRRIDGPYCYDINQLLGEKDMWACFSDIKDQVSLSSNPNRNPEEYEKQIISCLSSLSVPESEHRNLVQKVFGAVEAAENARLPVLVCVWETNRWVLVEPYTRPVGGRSNVTPAASSAIEGLESLPQVEYESIIRQEPSCAVCLEDFDDDVLDQQQPMAVTKLPCLHHFHLHCIAQSLEFSNLCPLCRYAMPTEEEN